MLDPLGPPKVEVKSLILFSSFKILVCGGFSLRNNKKTSPKSSLKERI